MQGILCDVVHLYYLHYKVDKILEVLVCKILNEK